MPQTSDAVATSESSTTNIPYPFRGVFAEIITKSVGFGATKRKEKIKRLWFVERDDEGRTTIRALNKEYLPSGEAKEADPAQVVAEYYPEPGIYMDKVAPKLREIERLVHEGDGHRAREEHYSAEYSYRGALSIDEDHIRANFGLGLTYLSLGDTQRAGHTFRKIVSMKSAFGPEHKHLFNEFGISLRKSGMFEECVQYYKRALELHPEDDHLLFNIARAHYDAQELDKSLEFTLTALENNHDLREARRLRDAIYEKDPSLRQEAATALDFTDQAV